MGGPGPWRGLTRGPRGSWPQQQDLGPAALGAPRLPGRDADIPGGLASVEAAWPTAARALSTQGPESLRERRRRGQEAPAALGQTGANPPSGHPQKGPPSTSHPGKGGGSENPEPGRGVSWGQASAQANKALRTHSLWGLSSRKGWGQGGQAEAAELPTWHLPGRRSKQRDRHSRTFRSLWLREAVQAPLLYCHSWAGLGPPLPKLLRPRRDYAELPRELSRLGGRPHHGCCGARVGEEAAPPAELLGGRVGSRREVPGGSALGPEISTVGRWAGAGWAARHLPPLSPGQRKEAEKDTVPEQVPVQLLEVPELLLHGPGKASVGHAQGVQGV